MAAETAEIRDRIARSFAQALYDLAEAQDRRPAVLANVNTLADVLAENPRLVDCCRTPTLSKAARWKLVEPLAEVFDPLMRNTLALMRDRDRLGLLPELVRAFLAEDDIRQGRIRVKLLSADHLAADVMKDIQETLATFLQRSPDIDYEVKPELLGGLVIRAGDVLIDASIRTRLKRVQEHLMSRGEDEIQSGRNLIDSQT